MALLERTDADGIAHLNLNAPEKLNALSEAMLDALQEQFDETVAKKDDLARQVDECATKLDRAQRLLGGLGGRLGQRGVPPPA